MISGTNITLHPPTCEWKTNGLKDNPEIKSLLDCITGFFAQSETIYNATLTLTNNEWFELNGDFGNYRKRLDFGFNLMDLKKVTLYDKYIDFNVVVNSNVSNYRVNVTDDFFYYLQWEDEYYN